jgi:hypothetical protein
MVSITVLGVLCAGCLSIFWLTPWGVPALKRLGDGAPSPDLTFGTRPADAYRLIERWGAKGVSHWRRMLWLDMIFPGLYAALLALLMMKWGQAVDAGPVWQAVAIVFPILAGASDCIENTLWLRILAALPKRSNGAVSAASFFTRAKFIFTGATLAIPLIHAAATRVF